MKLSGKPNIMDIIKHKPLSDYIGKTISVRIWRKGLPPFNGNSGLLSRRGVLERVTIDEEGHPVVALSIGCKRNPGTLVTPDSVMIDVSFVLHRDVSVAIQLVENDKETEFIYKH